MIQDKLNFGFNNTSQINDKAIAKTFMSNVFSIMGLGLLLTAVIAYFFGNNKSLQIYLQNPETGSMSIIGWIVLLAPIGIVLIMNRGYNKYSVGILMLLFGLFSALFGMSLSFIFTIYTDASIFKTFIITAGMFGTMALLGYTTKTDLTKLGSLLYMALFGIIIASVVNFFSQSETLDYIISFAGVIIFTGLTAYDVQKLKRIGSGELYPGEDLNKLAVLGAVSLYLDFINLFLFLLRFFGSRD